jgi:hypothetical protein
MASPYFILYREGRRLLAADASCVAGDDYPQRLVKSGVEYRRIDDEDTWMLWDELRDPEDRTVGFSFVLPESPSFCGSSFITDSENLSLSRFEAEVLLSPCERPRWECVQGFGCEIYQSVADPRECVLLMWNYSENSMGFDLVESVFEA